jgi:hypothetical protein
VVALGVFPQPVKPCPSVELRLIHHSEGNLRTPLLEPGGATLGKRIRQKCPRNS